MVPIQNKRRFEGFSSDSSRAKCIWQAEDDKGFEDRPMSCRAELDEAAFKDAVAEGRAITLEQAIAYALEE